MKNTAIQNEESLIEKSPLDNLDDIQIHHRDEVLKRIANFKEKTSDVLIDQLPPHGLGCTEIFCAVIINILGYIFTLFTAVFSGFYTIQPKQAVIF